MQDKLGWTALIFAAFNGRNEATELLLNKDADINKNKEGSRIAMRIAMQKGYTEIVHLLKQAGVKKRELE